MNNYNNAFVAVGLALLVLALGDRTVQIVAGIVMILVGLGTLFIK
jgi:hypothetical protein